MLKDEVIKLKESREIDKEIQRGKTIRTSKEQGHRKAENRFLGISV